MLKTRSSSICFTSVLIKKLETKGNAFGLVEKINAHYILGYILSILCICNNILNAHPTLSLVHGSRLNLSFNFFIIFLLYKVITRFLKSCILKFWVCVNIMARNDIESALISFENQFYYISSYIILILL